MLQVFTGFLIGIIIYIVTVFLNFILLRASRKLDKKIYGNKNDIQFIGTAEYYELKSRNEFYNEFAFGWIFIPIGNIFLICVLIIMMGLAAFYYINKKYKIINRLKSFADIKHGDK